VLVVLVLRCAAKEGSFMAESRALNFAKNDTNHAACLIIFLPTRVRFRGNSLFTSLFTTPKLGCLWQA
jgi:hypothetical protein